MSEHQIGKWFTKYFQDTSKLDSSNIQKFYNYLNKYAQQANHIKLIQLFYQAMQTALTKDNLKHIIKRYLYLMNVILERDDSVQEIKKYRNAVSHEIVRHFIYILKQLFNYQMTDEILLVKIYRKKWAKRITDTAFEKINIEAMRQLNNFNLDKGFQQEHKQKIAKGYQKRGFSQADIDKYLSIQQKPISETPKQQKVNRRVDSESSDEESESPKKKVKRDRVPSHERTYNAPDMMNNHSSYFVHNSFAVQPLVHNTHNNFCPPNVSYPYIVVPEHARYPPPMMHNDYQSNSQRFYPYNYPNIQYPQNYYQPVHTPTQASTSPYQTSNYSKVQQSKPNRKADPNQKTYELIQKLKSSQLYQCRSCGAYLSTQQTFSRHNYNHFLESQKNIEAKHSRRDPNMLKRTYLQDLQEWINSSKKSKQNQIRHFVPIQQLKSAMSSFSKFQPKSQKKCYICKSELTINWSDQLDTWVFEDSIRVNFDKKLQGVTHFECYQTLQDIIAKDNSNQI